MKKLLIALQFWKGDLAAAMETAKLIADIEPEECELADFLFWSRFDCETPRNVVRYVQNKFNVRAEACRRREIGWPGGCNGMWHELMCQSAIRTRNGEWDYAAILTMEGDSVPLQRDWIRQLLAEWYHADKLCVGHQVDADHINGNAIFNPLITMEIPALVGSPYNSSWDVFHGKAIIEHGYDSPLFVSRHGFRQPITEELLYKPRVGNTAPAFHHGVKDGSARDIVRRKLGVAESKHEYERFNR